MYKNKKLSNNESKAVAFRDFRLKLMSMKGIDFPETAESVDDIEQLIELFAESVNTQLKLHKDFSVAKAKINLIESIKQITVKQIDKYEFILKEDVVGMDFFDILEKVAEKENIVFTVSVYKVTRHFGGYEEGGWYYDWNELQESKNVLWEDALKQQNLFEKKYDSMKHGDISSIKGGVDYQVFIEAIRHENQSTETPIYE